MRMVNATPTGKRPQATCETVRLTGAQGLELSATCFLPPPVADRPPAILYTHGFGQTGGAWRKSAMALAGQGHAGLTYDARGHGDSQRNAPELRYDAEQFVDDLIIVAGEQAEPPVLVGASMGGPFGLIAESRWPGLFTALVLVDITPHWEQAGLARVLEFATAFQDGFASLEQAADLVAAYLPHRPRRAAQALAPLMRQGKPGPESTFSCSAAEPGAGGKKVDSDPGFHDNDAFTNAVLDYLGTLSRARHARFSNTDFDPASGARS